MIIKLNKKETYVGLKYCMAFYLRAFNNHLPSREKITTFLQSEKLDIKMIHAYLFYIYNGKYNLDDMSMPYSDWFKTYKDDVSKVNISVGMFFFQVLFETKRGKPNGPAKVIPRTKRVDLIRPRPEILCRFINYPKPYTRNEEYLKLKDPLAFYRILAFDDEDDEGNEVIKLDKYLKHFELDVDREKFINGMDDHSIIMKSDTGLVWNCWYIKDSIKKLKYDRYLWARINKTIPRYLESRYD